MSSDSPVAHTWVDHHLLLNAMGVLRNRVARSAEPALDLLDSISGYLSCGLYLERSRSRASLEWYLDWLECRARVAAATQTRVQPCEVRIDLQGDDAQVVELSLARHVANVLLAATNPADSTQAAWSLTVTVRDHGVEFVAVGARPDLAPSLNALRDVWPGRDLTVQDPPGKDAVRCEIRFAADPPAS